MPQDNSVSKPRAAFAWDLFTELRKELLESQKLRTQIIGTKVAFVSTAFAVIAANLDKGYDNALLVVPAFAAIFFDLLINSYSFSIKRIGWYCRHFLEPAIKEGNDIPEEMLLWEAFLSRPMTKQYLAMIGNLGVTFLAFGAGAISAIKPFRPGLSVTLLVILTALFALDVWSYWFSRRGGWFPTPQEEKERLSKAMDGRTERPAGGWRFP